MPNNRRRRPPASGPRRTTPAELADVSLINLDNSGEDFSAREPLFTTGGQTYTIPVRVSAGSALIWLEIATVNGDTAAMLWALRFALGDDGYTALRVHPNLSDDHYKVIVDAVRSKFLGALERPKAPSGT